MSISNWATARVASASKQDWVRALNVSMMLSVLCFALAFTGAENSQLMISPADLHSFVKQTLESF